MKSGKNRLKRGRRQCGARPKGTSEVQFSKKPSSSAKRAVRAVESSAARPLPRYRNLPVPTIARYLHGKNQKASGCHTALHRLGRSMAYHRSPKTLDIFRSRGRLLRPTAGKLGTPCFMCHFRASQNEPVSLACFSASSHLSRGCRR